jgi:hypothetical protein
MLVLVANAACEPHATSAPPHVAPVAPAPSGVPAAPRAPEPDLESAWDGRDAAFLANRSVRWTFHPTPDAEPEDWCPDVPLPSIFEDAIAPARCGGPRPGCTATGRRGMQIAFYCPGDPAAVAENRARLLISEDGGRTVSREHAVGFVRDVFFTERSLFFDFCPAGDCERRVVVLDRRGEVTRFTPPAPKRLPAAVFFDRSGDLRGIFTHMGAFDTSSAAHTTLMRRDASGRWAELAVHVSNRRGHCFVEYPTIDGAERARFQAACGGGERPGRHYMTYDPDGELLSDRLLPPGAIGTWGPRVVVLPRLSESPRYPDAGRGQIWESSDSGRTYHVVCAPQLGEISSDAQVTVECGPRGCAFVRRTLSARRGRVAATRVGWPALEGLPRVDDELLTLGGATDGPPFRPCAAR